VKSYKDLKHFETMYVVKLHNVTQVRKYTTTLLIQSLQLAESQECFTFVHPNRENPIDNTRYTQLKFVSSINAQVHGFAGFFDAQLYEDVHISTANSI
jgi:protein arginine N-methyltransferase 5